MARKRGRPHKWNPQIIAGWRHAKSASIAETARKWMVSPDTVKRACRDHGSGALVARQAWFVQHWIALHDRLEFVFEKRGGYAPVVRNLLLRIKMLEQGLLETEAALALRGIAYEPSRICQSPPVSGDDEEARKWRDLLEMEDFRDDAAGRDDDWEFSSFSGDGHGW